MKNNFNSRFYKKSLIIGLILLMFLLFNPKISLGQNSEEKITSAQDTIDYTPLAPIDIANDTALSFYSSSGTGSSGDPYIINGYNVTSSESMHGIYVHGTSQYFIIRDCWISVGSIGIFIYNLPSGTAKIINNTFIACSTGTYIDRTQSALVENNTCTDNGIGMRFYDADNSIVNNNSLTDNKMIIERSVGIDVTKNTLVNCGFYIYRSSAADLLSYDFADNTVNGLPFGYIKSLSSSTISFAYGQIILVNCADVTVKMNQITNTEHGIALYYCSYCDVEQNNCNYNNYGIVIDNSDHITVSNNTCNFNSIGIYCYQSNYVTANHNEGHYNDQTGISMFYASHKIIDNNKLSFNPKYGIYLYSVDNATIKNNVVYNSTIDDFSAGIGISVGGAPTGGSIINNTCYNNSNRGISTGSDGSTISNNVCYSNRYEGLYVAGDNQVVKNNTCYNNYDGLETYSAIEPIIVDNYCYENRYRGIYIRGTADYGVLMNNTCNDNGLYGMDVSYLPKATIKNNTFLNNDLYVSRCENSNITENDFVSSGLKLYHTSKAYYVSHRVINNTVNGLPLGYFENSTSGSITGVYGQLILTNCSDMTINDFTIEHTSSGISLYYSLECTLTDISCGYNNYYGIYAFESDNCTIEGSYCYSNGQFGIYLDKSENSVVHDCEVVQNGDSGISIEQSQSSHISELIASNNEREGVYCYYSDNTTIEDSLATGNSGVGISICSLDYVIVQNCKINDNNDDGIYVAWSQDTIVQNNTIYSNNGTGIYLEGSNYVDMLWNLIIQNTNIGIEIDSYSDYSEIYKNAFIENKLVNNSQALDHGTNNTWFDNNTLIGNYWSNYEGIGNYSIAGEANSTDDYPISIWSYNVYFPSVTTPADISFEEGTTGQSITWSTSDPEGKSLSYSIYQNADLVQQNTVSSGEDIIIDLNELEPGIYNYTIVIIDDDDIIIVDTVIVTVTEAETTTTTTTTTKDTDTTTTTTTETSGTANFPLLVSIMSLGLLIVYRKRKR
jgi:parallel beta-helix repeat protein